MKTITFEHNKQFHFKKNSGEIITMKALVTIHDTQFVECYESNQRYPAESLCEVNI